MPRVNPHESRWTPLCARPVCYRCGRTFGSDADKSNCRMCYEVFCRSCWGEKIALPPDYGYNTPQPVCRTCLTLLSLFPTFAAGIHVGLGGRLLLPDHYVIVVADNLGDARVVAAPVHPAVRAATRRSAALAAPAAPPAPAEAPGFFAKVAQFFGGGKRPDGASPASAAPAKGGAVFVVERCCDLTLVAFRPFNPDTRLVVSGAAGPNVPLTALRSVRFMGDRVRVNLADDKYFELIVVHAAASDAAMTKMSGAKPPTTATAKKASSFGRRPTEEEARLAEAAARTGPDEDAVITVDGRAAEALTEGLQQLLRQCASHFAFGRSAMVLHQDMFAASRGEPPPPRRPATPEAAETGSPATAAAPPPAGGVAATLTVPDTVPARRHTDAAGVLTPPRSGEAAREPTNPTEVSPAGSGGITLKRAPAAVDVGADGTAAPTPA